MFKRLPRWMIAELTYACPLQCVYCSNPIQIASKKKELSTKQWLNTFEEARKLGTIQLGLSGGEPLMRTDLVDLVKEASKMGFYINLITSGMGLTTKKLDLLKNAGLDAVQVSFQSDKPELNDFIGGKKSYTKKLEIMKAITDRQIPLTLNVVIHRLNIDRMQEICAMCDSMNPDYVEIANVQFHGWAMLNRKQLMPTPEQIEQAKKAVQTYQNDAFRRSDIYYVVPDMIMKEAKPCMNTWGDSYLCINPHGDVTPCLSAHSLPSLKNKIPSVINSSLHEIWNGEIFSKYKGLDWMDDPYAKTHPRRQNDGGGCRCQAFALTGNEKSMDPVCETSDGHVDFLKFVQNAYSTSSNIETLIARNMKNSKQQQDVKTHATKKIKSITTK